MMKRFIGMSVITIGVGLAMLFGCGEKTDQATQDMKTGVKEATEAAKQMGSAAKENVESAAVATKESVEAAAVAAKEKMDAYLDGMFQFRPVKLAIRNHFGKINRSQITAFIRQERQFSTGIGRFQPA